MAHNGWRKPTPGLVEAEKHAQVGERLSIPKSQAIGACKKVAAAIGLKAPDLLLLDTLAAITQPQDWEEGRRPIVWSSNAFLEEQTGFSLSALRRHVRRLCEAGVIAMKDSPNGKRWGKRDEDGYIVMAYGFDLGPLAARAEEFEGVYEQLQEERQFCQSLRNKITVMRRTLRAKIDKALESRLRGPWVDLQIEYQAMVDRLPSRPVGSERLLDLVDWFVELVEKVEQAFMDAFEWPNESDARQPSQAPETVTNDRSSSLKMTPRDVADDTHLQTTNQPYPVNSNSLQTKAATAEPSISEPPPSVERGVDLNIEWSTNPVERSSDLHVTTLMASCPRFAKTARTVVGGYVKSWNDIHRAAGRIRAMSGISEDAWNVAQRALGPEVAAAAVALIYDKYSDGEIKSPGGYLRGMVEKAQEGELHLDRSFYGRLAARGKA